MVLFVVCRWLFVVTLLVCFKVAFVVLFVVWLFLVVGFCCRTRILSVKRIRTSAIDRWVAPPWDGKSKNPNEICTSSSSWTVDTVVV